MHADGRKFGLVVDGIHDTQEIVVKPLSRQLRGISILAGATIMGNGKVALILDVLGLAVHARVVSELREGEATRDEPRASEGSEETEPLLLFEGPDDARMALSLAHITHLQEFPALSVERTGTQEVVQYRDEVLPLVRISTLLFERRLRQRRSRWDASQSVPSTPLTAQTIQAVIHSRGGRNVGLVVDRILDTVEQNISHRFPPSRKGVLASAVIQGRITEILDPDLICTGPTSASLTKRSPVEAKVSTLAGAQQFSSFLVNDLLFGIEVEKVQEVTRGAEITPVPLAPPTVRGLINLRGEIVTVIDIRRCLQLSERPTDSPPWP